MANSIPRAARSVLSDSSSIRISSLLRSQAARSSTQRSANAANQVSRPFSSGASRYAVAPATNYARKYDNNAPKAPTPATKADSIDAQSSITDMTGGLADEPLILDEGARQVDWTRSYHGLSAEAFSKEAAEILMAPIPVDDVEVKPDGILYLPEIKYRRILNRAFGPGAWGLAPRGETIVTSKSITREYALVAHGRLVSVARGEQDYFSPEGIPTATEGCKSNALMRCCKDLGVASELWDPRYIRKFMKANAKQVWAEHVVTKKKKQLWIRKDDELRYPYKESKYGS